MKPLVKNSFLLTVVLLIVWPSANALCDIVRFEVHQPTGYRKVIRGQRVAFSASVQGDLDSLHVVRIEGFGVTHNLFVDPAMASSDQEGKKTVWVSDRYLPHVPGEHKLMVQLFREGRENPLAKRLITVLVEQPTEDELRKKLELATQRITNSSILLMQYRKTFLQYSAGDGTRRCRTEGAVKEYLSSRNTELLQRLNGYGMAAEVYLEACMKEQAETAVRFAEEIYKQESSKVTSSSSLPPFPLIFKPNSVVPPPDHFRIAAELCIRDGDVEKAQGWILDSVAWYEHQRDNNPYLSANEKKRCNSYISGLYSQLARLCYLINQDLAGYRSWMQKANLLPRSQPSRGLLGQ